MGDIVDIQENKEEFITKEQIAEISETLETLLSEDNENIGLFKEFLTLISMDDENFKLLAPGVLQSYQQVVNNPNDKLALVQTLNASGIKAEDLIEAFASINDEIDKVEDLSEPKKDFLRQMIATIINSVQETEGIAKRIIEIPIELCHPEAKIPQYAHIDDSGLDVYALDDYTIAPGKTMLIPTGFKVALPPGYELQVRPKSGLSLKTKLRICNTPGTIDAGYRDEVGIIVENVEPPIRAINVTNWDIDDSNPYIKFSDVEFGQSYTIGKGQKFAQLVLSEVPKAAFYRVDTVEEIGENRNGGFGSTGLN